MGLEILITNDDGYTSNGIAYIVNLLSKHGNITLLAPKEGQSGMSAALSLGRPLRLEYISTEKSKYNTVVRKYSLNGTPADCIKMAMNEFYLDKKPDIIISGINHGANTSVASVYSGTLGACAEGTIYGIPSIGLSIESHNVNVDLSIIGHFFPIILEKFLKNPPQKGTYLNINFPALSVNEVKGIKFTSQGDGMWVEEFDKRMDPYGKEYYWMTGNFIDKEKDNSVGDFNLVGMGYITIVPFLVNNTNYNELERLANSWSF